MTGSAPSPWFEALFGFRERSWEDARARLVVDGEVLTSTANGRQFRIGRFDLPDLATLRAVTAPPGRLTVRHEVVDDILVEHARPAHRGAAFQVASQRNCLEFPSPSVVPEDGLTDYAADPTQGPACALAAAAGTAWRTLHVPVGRATGQTRTRQLDLYDGVLALLGPWFDARNGYTFSDPSRLARLAARLDEVGRERALGAVRVGVQSQVGVDFADRWTPVSAPTWVTQVFCSAVSCAYDQTTPLHAWEPLARLILDASYEATLRAAARDLVEGRGSGVVWLTQLGGGVFGNRPGWIADAMRRALRVCGDLPLDVVVAHHRRLDATLVSALQA